MNTRFGRKWSFVGIVLALALFAPIGADAETPFRRIVVFGDSLSDPGNAFILKGGLNTPPYNDPAKLDALLISEVPYASGDHHFSNGPTWIEQFARDTGLAGNAQPAYQSSNTGASNYAVGGARAHDEGTQVNLSAQVNAFLSDFRGVAPTDALYVVEFGGNDIRDALGAFAAGGDGAPIIADALAAIGNTIAALYAAGGRTFLVANAPDLGLTPAVSALGAREFAGYLSGVFNGELEHTVLAPLSQLPGIKIVRLDLFTKLHDLVANPAAFGLTVVDAACIMPNIPPFDCQRPDEYLFWDGIHPTKAVHAIMAQEAAFALTR